MSDSNNSLRQVAAYLTDMRRRGVYGSNSTPTQNTHTLWSWLRSAGLCARGSQHSLYAWYAGVHHIKHSQMSPKYSERAWTVAVYNYETFMDYSTTGRLGADLPGAMFRADSVVSQTRMVQEHGTWVMPFDRFEGIEIPTHGVWVALIHDVDDHSAPPQMVWHEYEVSKAELRTIAMTKSHSARIPLEFMSAHHINYMAEQGFRMPRLLWEVSEPRTGVLKLTAMEVELRTEMHPWSKWTRSPVGETIDSVMSVCENPNNDKARGPIVDKILEAAKKHRVSDIHGFYSAVDSQTVIGRPGDVETIADPSLATVAMFMAALTLIKNNMDKLSAALAQLDPDAEADYPSRRGYLKTPLNSQLSVEALFMAMSPSGRKSPVLQQLKRIFGDQGIPSLMRMVTGDSGLPSTVPSIDAGKWLDSVLASKVDMDSERGELISEQYLGKLLSHINGPQWGAGRSPLVLAVLVTAMPDNFVQSVQSTLTGTLDMRNAVLKHAGSPNPPDIKWEGRVAPGVYVMAPLEDFDRAARAIARGEFSVFDPVITSDYLRARTVIDALEAATDSTPQFEARQLQFRGQSLVAEWYLGQSNALLATDQSAKLAFDNTQMRAIMAVKSTTQLGQTLVMLIDPLTRHSFVFVASVAPDHRGPMLMDFMGLMTANTDISKSPDASKKLVARLRTTLLHTESINAYNSRPAVATSSDEKSPAEDNLPSLIELLRRMRGITMVPVRGSLDNSPIRVSSVNDESVDVHTFDQTSGTHVSMLRFPFDRKKDHIGNNNIQLVPSTYTYKAAGSDRRVHALSIGPQVYVQSDELENLQAVQNSNQTAVPAKLSAPVLHNPFTNNAVTLFNPRVINNSGTRQALADKWDPRLRLDVSVKGKHGLIETVDEVNDFSNYYGNSTNPWLSPFA